LAADDGFGYLVSNPAGDADLVDWNVISDLRFVPQHNAADFARAMRQMVDHRDEWRARRSEIRVRARAAFPAEVCLSRHAALLRAAALGQELPAS
jgi:hypothetical protein